jgi:uncharacterized protein YkwD
MRSVSLVIAVLALLVLAPGVAGASGNQRSSGLEAEVLKEINAVRAARGLKPLVRSGTLTRAADSHTATMLQLGAFTHEVPGRQTFSQRLRQFYAPGGVTFSAAENIALFGPDQPSARDIVAAWMGSPGHRQNLLGRTWREVGVVARFAEAPPGDFGGAPTWLITLDLGWRAPTA